MRSWIRGVSLKEGICLLLRLTGVPLLIREVVQRRRVTIVMYHRLDPEVADRHFSALRRHYTPISLQAYLAARRGDPLRRLPPKAVIVTIDDGHRSVHRLKSVTAKHRMPVTVFLCSGLVGTNRWFWFSAPGLSAAEREHLKTVPDERRVAALQALGFDQSHEFSDRETLSADEIGDLRNLIDFQGHSASHPILSACSDTKAMEELDNSKRQLEQQFGLRVNALAYPNGSYTTREIQIARQTGYECALTTTAGFNDRRTPPYELRRMTVRDDCGVSELLVRACGLWAFLRLTRSFAGD